MPKIEEMKFLDLKDKMSFNLYGKTLSELSSKELKRLNELIENA